MARKVVEGCTFYLFVIFEIALMVFLGLTYIMMRYADIKYIMIALISIFGIFLVTIFLNFIFDFKLNIETDEEDIDINK